MHTHARNSFLIKKCRGICCTTTCQRKTIGSHNSSAHVLPHPKFGPYLLHAVDSMDSCRLLQGSRTQRHNLHLSGQCTFFFTTRHLKQQLENGLDPAFTNDRVDSAASCPQATHGAHETESWSKETRKTVEMWPGATNGLLEVRMPSCACLSRCVVLTPVAFFKFSRASVSCSNHRRPRACTRGLHHLRLPQTPEVASGDAPVKTLPVLTFTTSRFW